MELDLNFRRKMEKLKFLGWGRGGRIRFGLGKKNDKVGIWGGVGGIRFGLGKKNGKFEIFWGGVGGIRFGLGKKYDKVKFLGWVGWGMGGWGWQNQIWTWEEK